MVALLSPHLDDAALAEVWTERWSNGATPGDLGSATRSTDAHVRGCAECAARYTDLSDWLDRLRVDARGEADEALTTERLQHQVALIARRLEALEQPARVIHFPQLSRPGGSQPGGRQRWVAAAAAAGVIVGVALGQMLNFGGVTSRQPDATAAARSGQLARGGQQTAARGVGVGVGVAQTSAAAPANVGPNSDEGFLYDQDVPQSQVRVPESLQYLNAITPGARDDPR